MDLASHDEEDLLLFYSPLWLFSSERMDFREEAEAEDVEENQVEEMDNRVRV